MDAAAVRRSAEAPVTASPKDLAEVARDLADAFHDDPHFDWFMRTDARRTAERRRFFHFLITNFARAGRIDRPDTGGAAAVWMPSAALGPASMLDDLKMARPALSATGLSRIGRLLRIRSVMDQNHPMDRQHLYLWFLGVTPGLQGMGIGSRLLRAGLDRADAAGLPAYLETGTTRNVTLYRRHGFEVVYEAQLGPDAPMMWHMWREPKAG